MTARVWVGSRRVELTEPLRVNIPGNGARIIDIKALADLMSDDGCWESLKQLLSIKHAKDALQEVQRSVEALAASGLGCGRCGVLVIDTGRHEAWHEALTSTANTSHSDAVAKMFGTQS